MKNSPTPGYLLRIIYITNLWENEIWILGGRKMQRCLISIVIIALSICCLTNAASAAMLGVKLDKVGADEAKKLADKALKKKVPINRDDIHFFIDTWKSGIINIRKNLDEQRIRQGFDELVVIKKQVQHQKDNLTILLNQKGT